MDRLKALEIAIEHLVSKYFGASAVEEIRALIKAEVKKLEAGTEDTVKKLGDEYDKLVADASKL